MFLVAAGISVLWLWREKRNGIISEKFALPSNEIFDETAFRYVLVGFLFWTVMLVSGAIWANNAWGRYWGWDPIETWSLICWLVYALFIHLHFTFKKLRGAFTAWYATFAVLVAAFSLWGVGYVYKTIHTYG
jgi:ABC-type transport system involved in cytochrome c biogenesis permease subunit